MRYGGKITSIWFYIKNRNGDHVAPCEDNGNGIFVEGKVKSFERGFGWNTGLALAISREILSITDKRINETGEFGKGARFEIGVPNGGW